MILTHKKSTPGGALINAIKEYTSGEEITRRIR